MGEFLFDCYDLVRYVYLWCLGGWKVNRFFRVRYERFQDLFNPRFFRHSDRWMKKKYLVKQNKSLTWKEVVSTFSRRQKTEYYAPLQSFWPIFMSFSLGLFLILLVASFHNEKIIKIQGFFLLVSIISISVAIAFWFAVFFLEKIQGNHNFKVIDNIEMGFFLFLFTEALCFLSLFWVFLHSTLAASIHVGLFNPGEGVAHFFINETIYLKRNWNQLFFHEIGTPGYFLLSSEYTLSDSELHKGRTLKVHINFYDKGQLIDPYKLPLLNTLILLTSAATLNISHLKLKSSKFSSSARFLFATILLGLFFVCVQYKEYKECTLQYNDGIYAACFFSLTGLHGFHVILGLVCLLICFFNILLLNYSSNFHQSFHYSILYWHFVDIIWILVYFIIYLWPSSYFFKGEFHSLWINYDHYIVNFDKKDLEKGVRNKIFSQILKNNTAVYNQMNPSYYLNDDLFITSSCLKNFENKNDLVKLLKVIVLKNKKEVDTITNNLIVLKSDRFLDFYSNIHFIFDIDWIKKSLPKLEVIFAQLLSEIKNFNNNIENIQNESKKVFNKYDKYVIFYNSNITTHLKLYDEFIIDYKKIIKNTNIINNEISTFKVNKLNNFYSIFKKQIAHFDFPSKSNDILFNFFSANKGDNVLDKNYLNTTSIKDLFVIFDSSLIVNINNKDLEIIKHDYLFKSNFFYSIEFILFEWYNTKDECNYNQVKKDPHTFCFVMQIMHEELFRNIEASFILDFKYHSKRVALLCYLFKINSTLTFYYIYYFMPYLFDCSSVRRAYNLREYR